MKKILSGVNIAVLGGDDRDLVLIEELLSAGAALAVAGFPQLKPRERLRVMATVADAIMSADVVILPLPGTNDAGVIRAIYAPQELVFTEEIAKKIPSTVPILIGVAKPFLKQLAAKYNLRLIETAEMDELAIYNAIPSAEGAIQLAMQEMPITIHFSQSFVLGFGRVGQTLARTLKALGAETTVVARSAAQLARAHEMSCRTVHFADLANYLGEADLIFNTVPSLVLDAEVLELVRPKAVIIDLASTPGGTDFPAAERLGIKAILAPGLPGKVAPVTAGRILGKVYPQLIVKTLREIGIKG